MSGNKFSMSNTAKAANLVLSISEGVLIAMDALLRTACVLPANFFIDLESDYG